MKGIFFQPWAIPTKAELQELKAKGYNTWFVHWKSLKTFPEKDVIPWITLREEGLVNFMQKNNYLKSYKSLCFDYLRIEKPSIFNLWKHNSIDLWGSILKYEHRQNLYFCVWNRWLWQNRFVGQKYEDLRKFGTLMPMIYTTSGGIPHWAFKRLVDDAKKQGDIPIIQAYNDKTEGFNRWLDCTSDKVINEKKYINSYAVFRWDSSWKKLV